MLAPLPRKMTFLAAGCAIGHCSGVSDKQRPIKKKWAGQELRSKSQAVVLLMKVFFPNYSRIGQNTAFVFNCLLCFSAELLVFR